MLLKKIYKLNYKILKEIYVIFTLGAFTILFFISVFYDFALKNSIITYEEAYTNLLYSIIIAAILLFIPILIDIIYEIVKDHKNNELKND
ncbi:MAG: hypothetical protein ACO2ON_00985 [Candidatus Nanopusillus sp.]